MVFLSCHGSYRLQQRLHPDDRTGPIFVSCCLPLVPSTDFWSESHPPFSTCEFSLAPVTLCSHPMLPGGCNRLLFGPRDILISPKMFGLADIDYDCLLHIIIMLGATSWTASESSTFNLFILIINPSVKPFLLTDRNPAMNQFFPSFMTLFVTFPPYTYRFLIPFDSLNMYLLHYWFITGHLHRRNLTCSVLNQSRSFEIHPSGCSRYW
jgi:hypothetical protein